MAPITIALDWTPNTNHTGFYVARSKGFYKDAGLEVQILSPHQDEYKTTPGVLLAQQMPPVLQRDANIKLFVTMNVQ